MNQLISIEECQNLIKQISKTNSNKIIIKDYEILPSTTNEENNFVLKITTETDNEEKSIQFLGKKYVEPNNNFIFEEFNKVNTSQFEFMPKSCFANNTNLHIYEDLLSEGYQNCKTSLDLRHIEMVLEKLAELHASSIIFEANNLKQSFNQTEYKLENEYNFYLIRKNFPNSYQNDFNAFLNLFNENVKEKVKLLIKNLEIKRIPSLKFRKTICHSNLQKQNILFKYNNNSIPVDCKLIEATPNYFPPAYDVLQLIFFNTNQEFRKNYIHKLFFQYYEFLKGKLNLENNFFRYEDFKISLNHLTPLIKLETVYYTNKNNNNNIKEAIEELEEIINFPNITREDCYEILEKSLNDSSYELSSFTQIPLDGTHGYLGEYLRLKIQIKQNLEQKTLNLFMKLMPKTQAPLKIISDANGFRKEIYFYRTIVPMVKALGIKDIHKCISQCYLTRPDDLMVFDDLSVQGYKGLSSIEPFSFEALEVTMRKLAQLHGSMLVFEERWLMGQNGTTFYGHFKEYLSETYFLKHEKSYGARIMQVGLKSVRDVVDLFPELKTERNQGLLDKYWDKLDERFYTATLPSSKFRNVLAHGDLWTSNLLFRFDSTNKPVDCKFIDFQVTRYCPPAHDILCILYIANDRKTRASFEDKVLDIYYEELTKVLSSYEFDIAEILPYDSFIESIEYTRPQNILMSFMYNQFSVITSEQRDSFLKDEATCEYVFFNDRKKYLADMYQVSPIWRQWLRDDVEELYELCELFDKQFS